MLTNYVDPFIGNEQTKLSIKDDLCKSWFFIKALCGNTSPAAVLPFGMLSAVPYTGGYPTGYGKNCPNYCYKVPLFSKDIKLRGFTHFSHSGTGAVGFYYNFIRCIPCGEMLNFNAEYKIKNEHAVPGKYSVSLPEIDLDAALTVTKRAAIHLYDFKNEGSICIDFSSAGLNETFGEEFFEKIEKAQLFIDNNCVAASFCSNGIFIYVYIMSSVGKVSLFDGEIINEKKLIITEKREDPFGAVFEKINPGKNELVLGFSFKSVESAKRNAKKANKIGFETAASNALAEWENSLSKIEAEFLNEDEKKVFYTAMYHSMIKPSDCEGESWLWDDKDFYIDTATLWDQYKTQIPLMNLLFPKRASAFAKTQIMLAETLGHIPNSFLISDETNLCESQARMLGCHVIADAILNGVPGIDKSRALNAAAADLRNQNEIFFESGRCERYTHILDAAEGCACMAEIALLAGEMQMAELFQKASENWINAYDEKTGLLSENSWYYEGTLYNYSFRLLHNMKKRMELANGANSFVEMLDDFFGFNKISIDEELKECHGEEYKYMQKGHELHRFEGYNNEPDMETPYAYLYAGRHDKTSEIVRKAMRSMFNSSKGGLPGNDDSGGLSSCYVWNSLGIFPVCGQGIYLLGSPSIKRAKIHLGNGNKLEINALNQGKNTLFAEKIIFNGEELKDFKISASELLTGGKLDFYMTEKRSNYLIKWLCKVKMKE